MSKRKEYKKYVPKSFESRGEKYIDNMSGQKVSDTSANIYESMLTSDAYKDLSTRQKQLYTCCKAQYYGKRKPKKDYEETGLFQEETYFYLNHAVVVEKYGLYSKNMNKEFYSDMKILEEHGFIRNSARGGGNGKKKSVYQYIDAWQDWRK